MNCSLIDKDWKNSFYDESKSQMLADICKKWIARILEYAKNDTEITNPIEYSYKCRVWGYEVLWCISWNDANRKTLCWITATRGNATRTELNSRDSIANPYLAFASILATYLELLKIIKKHESNIFESVWIGKKEREKLGIGNFPENLKDDLNETLEVEFINKFSKIKNK